MHFLPNTNYNYELVHKTLYCARAEQCRSREERVRSKIRLIRCYKYLLSFLLIISFFRLWAQKKDSTLLSTSTQAEQLFSIKQSTLKNDTIIDNTQNYYQMGVLGNIGLPSYSLLAQENNSSSNFFKWTNLNNRSDLFTEKDPVYFYPSGKVSTKIVAAMGQKQEQVFKLQHSQNIKRVNISLLFNRYSCFGFYTFQKTITDNLLASSHYTTKNGRWGYNFSFIYNKLKYQLNGGIRGDSLLGQNVFVDKQLIPVNLSTAKQNMRTSSISFSTFMRLNKSDTTNASHFIVYETNYQSNYWLYTDGFADSAFYTKTYFYRSAGSIDSASVKSFSNSLLYKTSVSLGKEPLRKLVFYAGYKNEISQYNQFNIDTSSLNHIVRGGLSIQLKNQLFNSNMHYVLIGYNQTNYLADANYFLKFTKSFFLDIKVSANKQMPAFITQRLFTSHFIWNNTFKDVVTQNATAVLGSTKYKFTIGAFAQQQQNQIYFDTLAEARQYKGSTLITRFFIQKDLRLWHLHFNNTLNYQVTQNTDIIRLPQLVSFSQLYYEGKLFKNNLWLQVGVQARYVSSFMANGYMPATNQFYLQNVKTYGDYVFADVFINAQIERFRFFLLAQHVNQGLMGGNYILCPNYPMPDRSFKAGLAWMFFD